MTPIAATAIHAPLANLDTTTMTRTTAVTPAPMVLMAGTGSSGADLAVGDGAQVAVQCRIIPVWLHTNETKTPTM